MPSKKLMYPIIPDSTYRYTARGNYNQAGEYLTARVITLSQERWCVCGIMCVANLVRACVRVCVCVPY